jgi:nucleoside-diphosphate kinase
MERTLVLIKPDAVGQRKIGEIVRRFEAQGLQVVGLKMVFLKRQEGARFYQVHQDKPFYQGLIEFIASGPIVAIILDGKEAISRVRELMGSTDPAEAKEGTIRHQMGTTVQQNAVHGSDSLTSAAREIPFFFNQMEIFPAATDDAGQG